MKLNSEDLNDIVLLATNVKNNTLSHKDTNTLIKVLKAFLGPKQLVEMTRNNSLPYAETIMFTHSVRNTTGFKQ